MPSKDLLERSIPELLIPATSAVTESVDVSARSVTQMPSKDLLERSIPEMLIPAPSAVTESVGVASARSLAPGSRMPSKELDRSIPELPIPAPSAVTESVGASARSLTQMPSKAAEEDQDLFHRPVPQLLIPAPSAVTESVVVSAPSLTPGSRIPSKVSLVPEPDEAPITLVEAEELAEELAQAKDLVHRSLPELLIPAPSVVTVESVAVSARSFTPRSRIASKEPLTQTAVIEEDDGGEELAMLQSSLQILEHVCLEAAEENNSLRQENAALRVELEQLLSLTASLATPPPTGGRGK